VLRLTCHVIVIRSLSWNVGQSDLSLSVPPNWQRFSTVMQTLKCLSVPSNHHWKGYPDVNWKGYPDVNWKGYSDIVDYVFTELQMKFVPVSGGYKSASWWRELRRIQTHRTIRSMRTDVVTTKLIRMHVGAAGANMWFSVLVWKAKSITSISVHEHLTFVKHIYVDLNNDVIAVRLSFMQ
jgi:hypothetical protein